MWRVTVRSKPVFKDSPTTVQEPDIELKADDWTSARKFLDYVDPTYLKRVTIECSD